ncbi:putative protein kinase RLK-Pelle-SD-2b family [Helianthus annuus]|uniref:Receptor-like serine/threonine-protein kinase n=1 Tax=Helianthus annuus TaxID=4232 RepID=A0A251S990_HELAN|nr:putative protein kinase RLK-Pelle-SD-2b family [Helianthus annuus]KAJ0455618.1 putative protein kinase RLK-Pelle-SD-2b family [Helianthus annuus]KAJ0831257.1 putative protein kinase RLK-Pelle-SD-2b family [Helianthus annuus]KAJ0844700.1 putative protein kinase RLK-Pelle-SD-2b family [Helianthus annuus]
MGFFRPGNSSNYYIGIWYNKTIVTIETVVWVANRDTPISDSFTSKLKIVDGNLVLLNESNSLIWSTNMNSTATAASATLLDDGNLVLRYGSGSSLPIWQSFDHPTHTFLPGMKLGYDKRTNTSQVLTSWRSVEDPGVGLFSLEIDQNERQYLVKWNRSVDYWSTGSWNDRDKLFELAPEVRKNHIYNISYVDNENESYFTYSLYNRSIISRFIIDVSGQIKQLTWSDSSGQWNMFWSLPQDLCRIYGGCGEFGVCSQSLSPSCSCLIAFKPRSKNDWNLRSFSSGCVRKTEVNCSITIDKPAFILSYVEESFLSTFPENEAQQLDESSCSYSCLHDCSCNAYTFISNVCHHWNHENMKNISLGFVSNDSYLDTSKFHIKVASKDIPHLIENSGKKNKDANLGAVVGSIAVVVFVLCVILFMIRRRKTMILVGKTTMEGSLMAFVYRDLQIATKNFTDKLGGGSFGSVFKGVLHDSTVVAVKKLESVSQGEKEFRSEVGTLGIIQHVNLVRLCGFCAQGKNRLLVYDYMPNGSLNSRLFNEKEYYPLSWKARYQIALGIARGLVYLHERCRDRIIHCDLKPENILLDADFCPKIADFGLAKLMGRDFSRVLTTMRGTRGYLAPEWLSGVPVTAKADVFSYGMILFELVHGKRNSEQSEDFTFKFFPSLAANVLMVGGDILSLLDSRLNREANLEQVTKILKVAYWCIQDEEDSRPSMSEVERILEGVLDVSMPPVPQYVKYFDDDMEDFLFFKPSSGIQFS